MKKLRVDYLRNCVEEAIKRHLSDSEYISACTKSYEAKCKSMQDRIDEIIKNL